MNFIEITTETDLDTVPYDSWVLDSECAIFYRNEVGEWEDNTRRFPKDKPQLPAVIVSGVDT